MYVCIRYVKKESNIFQKHISSIAEWDLFPSNFTQRFS